MADTTYTDNVTVITADTMNDLNRLHYTILSDPADLAAVRTKVTDGKVTVASHATTADIWAGNCTLIDWTGTATTTAFPAAPYAGAYRELYCAAACLFTAGANLLIEGIPSGTTITLAAGALVRVRAITTTQFKLTYSLSGTFTATCTTGMTTTPSATATYTHENGRVCISIPALNLTGTSNSAAFIISGMPNTIKPPTPKRGAEMTAMDNSAFIYAYPIINTTGLINMSIASGDTWTTSGTKRLDGSEISYLIA